LRACAWSGAGREIARFTGFRYLAGNRKTEWPRKERPLASNSFCSLNLPGFKPHDASHRAVVFRLDLASRTRAPDAPHPAQTVRHVAQPDRQRRAVYHCQQQQGALHGSSSRRRHPYAGASRGAATAPDQPGDGRWQRDHGKLLITQPNPITHRFPWALAASPALDSARMACSDHVTYVRRSETHGGGAPRRLRRKAPWSWLRRASPSRRPTPSTKRQNAPERGTLSCDQLQKRAGISGFLRPWVDGTRQPVRSGSFDGKHNIHKSVQ